jgi:hypothetical protein
MRRGRRRNDPWDQPWVTIAAVVGVIAVIGIAVFFFLGSGGSDGAPAATESPVTTSGSSPSAAVVSGTIDPATIKEQTTASVPGEGVFVKVSYLGSFSGQYGMEGAMLSAKDSGERLYEIENANRTISATFRKTDSSIKPHELVVEIWENGKVLKFGKNTSPNGEVSIDYPF